MARSRLEKISDTSWKQYLNNRTSYELWSSHKEVACYCQLNDRTKRLLKIEFAKNLQLSPFIDYFTITSGKEIRFSKELQEKINPLVKTGFFIVTVLDIPTANTAELEEKVAKLLEFPDLEPPEGVENPEVTTQNNVQSIKRDPKVKAWVIRNAKGCCEYCKDTAFVKDDGKGYLEVHHLRQLANHGSDKICNTVAVCANCHRKLHYAENREEILSKKVSQYE